MCEENVGIAELVATEGIDELCVRGQGTSFAGVELAVLLVRIWTALADTGASMNSPSTIAAA